jgi:hypothetical protein
MVARPQPVSDALLARAAELRAGGATWAAVGAKLGRRPESVQKWPRRYRKRWAGLLAEAERQQAADAAAEGVHVLRRQLRSDDDRTSREAAHRLLGYKLAADKAKPPPSANPSPARRLADHLETLADDDLRRLFDDLVRHWLDAHGSRPDPPAPPSQD